MNDGGYVRGDQGGVFVGRYCSIGRRVTLGAGGHSLSGLSSSPSLRGVKSRPYKADDKVGMRSRSRIGPVIVGSDVWIGDGAVVMSGVTIGVGAVIAANAVVTEDVAPYHMVGGVPAKIIGCRFDSTVVDSLLKLEWWECGCVELNSLPLANINQFIESFNLASSTFPTLSISSS
jgi:virginiamycin A acetyltransferase